MFSCEDTYGEYLTTTIEVIAPLDQFMPSDFVKCPELLDGDPARLDGFAVWLAFRDLYVINGLSIEYHSHTSLVILNRVFNAQYPLDVHFYLSLLPCLPDGSPIERLASVDGTPRYPPATALVLMHRQIFMIAVLSLCWVPTYHQGELVGLETGTLRSHILSDNIADHVT